MKHAAEPSQPKQAAGAGSDDLAPHILYQRGEAGSSLLTAGASGLMPRRFFGVWYMQDWIERELERAENGQV